MFLGLKAPRAPPPPPQTRRPACFSHSLGSGMHSVHSVLVGCNANSSAPKCKGIAKQIAKCVVAHSSAHQRAISRKIVQLEEVVWKAMKPPEICHAQLQSEFCMTQRAGSYAGACGPARSTAGSAARRPLREPNLNIPPSSVQQGFGRG